MGTVWNRRCRCSASARDCCEDSSWCRVWRSTEQRKLEGKRGTGPETSDAPSASVRSSIGEWYEYASVVRDKATRNQARRDHQRGIFRILVLREFNWFWWRFCQFFSAMCTLLLTCSRSRAARCPAPARTTSVLGEKVTAVMCDIENCRHLQRHGRRPIGPAETLKQPFKLVSLTLLIVIPAQAQQPCQ